MYKFSRTQCLVTIHTRDHVGDIVFYYTHIGQYGAIFVSSKTFTLNTSQIIIKKSICRKATPILGHLATFIKGKQIARKNLYFFINHTETQNFDFLKITKMGKQCFNWTLKHIRTHPYYNQNKPTHCRNHWCFAPLINPPDSLKMLPRRTGFIYAAILVNKVKDNVHVLQLELD